MDLSKLNIEELLNYEKAAQLVCSRYEKNIKMYDGSLATHSSEYEKFDFFNKLYIKIFEEIENRLRKL
jgi:hypothetical protein